MKNEKVVCVYSGGLDSTTLLYDLVNQGYDVHALGFAYGQKHIKECQFADVNCQKLKVPYTKMGLVLLAPSALTREDWQIPEGHYQAESMRQTVVPNRNLTMLVQAATFAITIGATKLFYGAHAGDHFIYPDCRPEFIEALRQTLLLSDERKVDLQAPYTNMTKGDIVKKGLSLGIDYSNTVTCYNGINCGKCGSCQERLEAFAINGVKDPLKYK